MTLTRVQSNTSQMLVNPRGTLLNDLTRGVDHLNYSAFAKAFARKIHEVTPPLTIGVYGKWGSGKSQFLMQVKKLLAEKSDDKEEKSLAQPWKAFTCRLISLLLFVVIIAMALVLFVQPEMFHYKIENNKTKIVNETKIAKLDQEEIYYRDSKPQYNHSSFIIRYAALSFLVVAIVIVFVICLFGNPCKCKMRRLLWYATFTKIPQKRIKYSSKKQTLIDGGEFEADEDAQVKDEKVNTRFIFVDFNSWEYAGSDTLWAAIVTNLSKEIEKEFGTLTSRLFRLLSIEEMQNSKDPNNVNMTLFLKLPDLSKSNKNNVDLFRDFLNEVGKVEKFVSHPEFWWEVKYSNHDEADRALELLRCKRIYATFVDPKSSVSEFDSTEHSNGSQGLLDRQNQNKREGWLEKKYPKLALFLHFLQHFGRNPKTVCNMPLLFWWVISIVSATAVSVVVVVLAGLLHLDIFRFGRAVPVIVQVIAWMPPALGVLFVITKLIWAIFDSQRKRIRNALQGTKGNLADELGFMRKVKDEITIMTEIVRCAEFTHNRKYKIVITIDDLDRISHEKIRAVLDAVSILLSDKNSPFICLIAVDLLVAAKSVEEGLSKQLIQCNLNGYDYLKKIINLPFSLPQIDATAKKQFVYGLITMSDEVRRKSSEESEDDVDQPTNDHRNSSNSREEIFADCPNPNTSNFDNVDGIARSVDANSNLTPRYPSLAGNEYTEGRIKFLTHQTFQVECRKFILDETTQFYLDKNPRSIKRIYNIMSLTLWVFYYLEKESQLQGFLDRNRSMFEPVNNNSNNVTSFENDSYQPRRTQLFARQLVTWIILLDQWPYRMSFILLMIEEEKTTDINDETSLFQIYSKFVLPKLMSMLSKEEIYNFILTADQSHTNFYDYLSKINKNTEINLKVKTIKQLMRITINLAGSMKQIIGRHLLIADTKSKSATENSSSSSS